MGSMDNQGTNGPGKDTDRSGELEKALLAAGVPPGLAQSAFGMPTSAEAGVRAHMASARWESDLDASTRAVVRDLRSARVPEQASVAAADWVSLVCLEKASGRKGGGVIISPLGLLLAARMPIRTFERIALQVIESKPPALFTTVPDPAAQGPAWSLFKAFAQHGRATPKTTAALLAAGFEATVSDVWEALSTAPRTAAQVATLLWDSRPPEARVGMLETLQRQALGALAVRVLEAGRPGKGCPVSGLRTQATWLLEHGVTGFAAVATGVTERGEQVSISFYDALASRPETMPLKNELMNIEIRSMAARAMQAAPAQPESPSPAPPQPRRKGPRR